MVQGFSHAVEHEPDAHACGKHHGYPGDGAEFGFFPVFAQRDVAELTDGEPQHEDHEERSQHHEEPAGVLHDPVENALRRGRKAIPSEETPHHEGDGACARDPECDLVEGQLAVPTFRHGPLGLALTQFLQELIIVFGIRDECGREGIRGSWLRFQRC